MSIEKSISIVKSFLASDACTSGFNYEKVEGLFVATLCCSEYVNEELLAEFIVGEPGPGLDQWFFGELRDAWMEIVDHLEQQLFENEYVPDLRFPVAEDATAPSKQIIDWSNGFLMGFALTLQVWTDDFALIKVHPEFEGLSSAEEDVEMILALFSSFANWQNALAENGDPAKLQAGFPFLWQTAQSALLVMYNLALELQEIKLAIDLEQETAPYVREVAKVGRNDPCPCGSGKKYKKCCITA